MASLSKILGRRRLVTTYKHLYDPDAVRATEAVCVQAGAEE